MRYLVVGCLSVVLATTAVAQQLRPKTSAEIYGDLIRLRTLTSVLYVAAHPDDENTRLLAWLARGRHIRTSYLSLTRGDGGQNIIGGEQGAALGLIRTHELLAARALDGAEQYFARPIDFGFSKNPDETFRQWDKAKLVDDVKRIINTLRPDVVICRFPKDSMAGHGQHSASAIVTEEAFASCMADPTSWKPTRLLFNAFRFGNRSTITDDMFRMQVGEYDPLLGMGYGELAGISRSLHKSQGAGTPQTPGVQPEHFKTWAGAPPVKSLFDGVDTTWQRVGRADIGRDIDGVVNTFDMLQPARSVDALLQIRRKIVGIADTYWRTQKLREIDAVLLSCLGVTADVTVATPIARAGDSAASTLRVTTRAGRSITLADVTWPDGTVRTNVTCPHDSLVTLQVPALIPSSTPVTEPYWLAKDARNAFFTLSDERLLGEAVTPSALPVTMRFAIGVDTIVTSVPLSFKKLDPLRGDLIEAIRIVPDVSIEPLTRVVAAVTGTARITARIRAYAPVANAALVLSDAGREVARLRGITVHAMTDTLVTLDANVTRTSTLRISLETSGTRGTTTFTRQVNTITYDHIPALQYTQPAEVRVVAEPIKIAAKRIAYVAGAGEYTPEWLRSMGVTVDEITDEALLKTETLLGYDAVLVGIRAINVRPSMKYLMPALNRYVEQGGTVVMQYMTTQDMSTKDLGPFPLPLSRARVTEEDAAVTILQPDHALLTKPNVITAIDFTGWVQERGLYFPDGYDAQYQALLSMHDAGEQPYSGSLLYARHGKGHYVYCALSLFRQIPAGVPGGMKLMANLLSIGS
ncbi:MAG: PIG-L family deacetylase [Candidatus Kapabacteria bacterium]|nr:PIG-L family deacetylase [Candidatus Kapabacteria bacterium]